MLIYVRFQRDSVAEPAAIEEAALGAIGRAGTVLGASDESVDLEIEDDADVRALLAVLAAALRRVGLTPATLLELPESGQRFSIYDF